MKKRGAISFSMTTIIIIVLSVMILIFAGIFVKNIMCAGIILTDKITDNMENEIINLFGDNDYGVKCLGEDAKEVKFGDGGQRQVFCVINTDEEVEYNFEITEIKSLSGASQSVVESWVIDEGWSGTAAPKTKTATVMVLDLPHKLSKTNLKITIQETNQNTGVSETHISYITVVPVSGLTSAIC